MDYDSDTTDSSQAAKLYFVLDANGNPIEVSYRPEGSTSTTFYYFVQNLQGDVVALVNSTYGNTVVTYTYDAWGNVLSVGGSMAETLGKLNPFRYRGYVYDNETTLYYLQSRYYDPAMGRFINADAFASTGQGILGNNMFAYCNNSPVAFYDPRGTALLPVLGLTDYYLIHKMVQCLVLDAYGYAMEVYITSPFGNGRLDLFDAMNNQYYEVKHAPLAPMWNDSIQKLKYDNCIVHGRLFKEYYFDQPPTAGWNLNISGEFQYGYWDVTFSAQGNGLITYSAYVNKSRYFKFLQVTTNAVAFAATGAVAGYFYGKATNPGGGRCLNIDFNSN